MTFFLLNCFVVAQAQTSVDSTRLAQDFYETGDLRYDSGNYAEAIADYDKAILLKLNFADAFNSRGYSKSNLFKYEEALLDLNEAVRLNPNNPFYFRNRAQTYEGLKKYANALTDYDEAIRLKPSSDNLYNFRASIKVKLKKYDEAFSDYDEAIRLNLNNSDSWLGHPIQRAHQSCQSHRVPQVLVAGIVGHAPHPVEVCPC